MITNPACREVRSFDPHLELLEGCRKYDHRAQLQIYRLYYKSLFNACVKIVNDPAEAENIMQEAFLDAFEEIGRYSGTISFGDWLMKFLEKRLISGIKSNKY